MKTFNIMKHDSLKSSSTADVEIIATVQGETRREAFKAYCETISSLYHTDFKNLKATRRGRNKRRRLEILTIEEVK